MFKKIISEFVAVIFLFSVVSVDFARAAVVPLPTTNSLDMFKINDAGILKNFAKVTALKNFDSDTVVLNIQDFHMHPGVQQNISSIIKALVDNYSVKNVYLEGAYDEVDTNWLSNITNSNFKDAVINKLTSDGKLTGAEIYSINNNKQNFILPLEDKKLHKENIARLAKILADKPDVLIKLDNLEKELALYQKKYLSIDNKNFTEVVQKHDSGKIDNGKFYKLLFAYLKKNSSVSNNSYGNIIEMNVDDYPNISKYLKAYQLQNRINLKDLSEDLKALMGSLKKELSYEEYNKIITTTNNLKDLDALISSLVVLPSEYKQKYATKQLQDFVEATKIYKEINPVELINEERSLIEQIRGALSKNKVELEVSFLTDFFKYFKDFMVANISADNRQYFAEKIDTFISLWDKYSFYNKPMMELVERIPLINEYYNVNDYRNEVFMEKMKLKNNKFSNSELPINSFSSLLNNKNIVVVITGGYHTKGLTDLLLKNNISYAVITPTVSGSVNNTYEKYENAVKEEAKINSQTLASAAISLIGLEQSYVISLLEQIQKDNNFNLDEVVSFIDVINATKEQKISYEYDKQNQQLQLSDGKTQLVITKDGIKVDSLAEPQKTKTDFNAEKVLEEINKNIRVFSSAFSFFNTGIFYPDLFKTLDGFETFLIERDLMPAFSNGFIPEIEKDVDFQNYINENYPGGVLNFVQKSYALQRDYYKKEKNNVTNVKNTEDNVLVNDIYSSIEGKHSSFVSDDLLANAKIGGYAIGAFNMNNLDQLMAIVNAAVKANSPLMIEISEGALGYSADNPKGMEKFNYLVETYKMIAATMPGLEMILHLDHSKLKDVGNGKKDSVAAKKAIDMGFSSVMLDCSKDEIKTNKEQTLKLVEYAHKKEVANKRARVEAEIGAVDLGDQGYTTPDQAFEFVDETGVDSLAIAVGTAHGANKNNPQLQFMLIAEIAYELYKKQKESDKKGENKRINIPLVLHGASAVPEDKIIRFNGAGGEKENASGVPMNDTKAAIKWKTLLNEAKEDIEKKAKQDKNFDHKKAEKKLKEIEEEITDAGLLEQGVISKVNVATDLLVAGATNLREQVYTQNLANTVISGTVITDDMLSKATNGINHKFEQEETTNLVIGKMEDLGSARKINGKLSKDEINIPKSKLKPVDELKSKDSVLRYNVGSIEEIQAVVNNIRDNKNIIFTIDENTRQRYDYSYDGKKYNALIFAIETAARYNEDINFAVEIVNTKDIDDTLTEILIDILEKGFTHNEKEDKFIIDTSKLEKAELVYLKKAIENKEIVNLQAIADDITQKYLKANPSQHDVRKWGEEYRNKIWVLADALDNGYIFKDIDDDYNDDYIIESKDKIFAEISELINDSQDYDDEILNELRMFDDILEGKIAQETDENKTKGYKSQFAVYAAGGRIGQPNVWTLAERKDVDLSMIIVSTRLNKDEVPYSVYHDSGLRVPAGKGSIHGDFNGDVRWCEENELTQIEKEKYDKYKKEDLEREKEGKKGVFLGYLRMESNKTGKVSHVAVFATKEPADINFEDKIVLNTSGHYKTEEEAEVFINKGAKKVLLSAPGEMPVLTNATRQNYEEENILSGASCTTNALHIPLLLIIEKFLDVDSIDLIEFDGFHAATNNNKEAFDLKRATSGAGVATAKINHPIFKALKGKIDGGVIRVGNRDDGSSVKAKIFLKKQVKITAAEINEMLKNESQNAYKGMLGYDYEGYELDHPNSEEIKNIIDSIDAGMFIPNGTFVGEYLIEPDSEENDENEAVKEKKEEIGTLIEFEAWYDNETGYANQYVNLGIYAGRFEKVKEEAIKLLKEVNVDVSSLENENITFKEIYKVFKYEVMSDQNKMAKIKKEAEKGNYIAQTIIELADKLKTESVEETGIKVENSETTNFFAKTAGVFLQGIFSIKDFFTKIFGSDNNKKIDVDLIYVENFQELPRDKRNNIFDKDNNKVNLYISLDKNNDVNQEKQLEPSGIDNKNIHVNKNTGVIYVNSKNDIDSVTSNIAAILRSFGVDNASDFSIVVSEKASNDEEVLSINNGGVIKTSEEFTDAARNVVKTLTGVMSRNLVVMLEGKKDDIDTQLNIMGKIGNKTITLPAEYFDKKDIYVIKSCISNLSQQGISVIIEYNEKDAKIDDAYKLGFAGHIITSVDDKGIKTIREYENYSLNEKIDVKNNCRILPTVDSLKQFDNIKTSNETVFVNGGILKEFVKGRDFLQVRQLLNGFVVNLVKFFNENIDKDLIENFVFELPKENIVELTDEKISDLQNKLKNNEVEAVKDELKIDEIKELKLFENKIKALAKEQNKDENQLIKDFYKAILKVSYIKTRNPLGFVDRNIEKMIERNALIELNSEQKQVFESIISVFEPAKKKMNAEELVNFVYELAYCLDASDFNTAQKLLEGIDFKGEIKDQVVAKAAAFELLMLFADRKIKDIDFEKDNFDDIKNVVNILTAA